MMTWALLWVVGCSGNPPQPTLASTALGEPCDPPLQIIPESVTLAPSARVQFTARGGERRYGFALRAPASGTINSETGVYVAPATRGSIDEVVLTDRRCSGEAVAEVTTGDGFSVLPVAATVLPGTVFALEITGGSSDVVCGLIEAGSGGTVTASDCVYQAGKLEGVDRIEVVDRVLDVALPVTVTVDLDARLDVWGHELWGLPLGSVFTPRIEGGSQVYDLAITAGPAQTNGGSVTAATLGEGTVMVRDRFAGFEEDITYRVLAPLAPPSDWFGKQLASGVALGPGDLNGDGAPDAVIGFPEVNGSAYGSGAVVVFAGTGAGLQADPVWQVFGEDRESRLGTAAVMADLDGDGHVDLVVGAPGSDGTGADKGEVLIWRGVSAGFFATKPDTVLRGPVDSDRAGSSLAACDFDGDGWIDVAVGAPGHEERGGPGADDSGAVLVYRGGPGGLPAEPSVIRYGQRPTGVDGAFEAVASTRLGVAGMAAGDVDGDGRCDLAVASDRGVFGAGEPFGFVALFRGLVTADGTLSAEPALLFANDVDADARFGHALAFDDVDRDGNPDLVVGAPGWDGAAGPSAGAVFVYRASSLDGRAAHEPYTPADADWLVTGDASGDQLGLVVGTYDLQEDGYADVLAGAPRGDAAGIDDVGHVRIWDGVTLATRARGFDATGDPGKTLAAGTEVGGWFGQSAAVVGDADGDGSVDLIVLAGRTDDGGLDVGSAVLARSNDTLTSLNLPGEPSGHDHGRAVAVLDVDGDGADDVIVGSPEDGDLAVGILTGSVHAFAGSGGGFASQGQRLGGVRPDDDASDRRGQSLSVAGDFDGDGERDLAVVARTDERPDVFDASRVVNPDACPGDRPGAGSVAVHRGTAQGLQATPAFMVFGPDPGAGIDVVVGGLDFNGDGLDDLVLGGPQWFGTGGFAIVLGRAADPAGTTVICDAQVWNGVQIGNRTGASLAAIPDLDDDGCDELAVGSPGEDSGVGDQGVIRVIWGYGSGCPTSPRRMTALGPDIGESSAGDSLASGGDLDGDGTADLAVGGTRARVSGTELGSLWVVPGSYLRSRPPSVLTVAALPGGGNTTIEPLVPGVGRFGVLGVAESSAFGQAVAMVPDPANPGRSLVAVGAPQGDEGGVDFAGGVHLYRFDPSVPGLSTVPMGIVGGETPWPGGRLGQSLWGGTVDDASALVIGAPRSSRDGLELGAAYVFLLE